jgi:predicted DsbA family dithiol-disulfide isomerase
VQVAARFGRADAVADALFSAYFCDGQDIGAIAVLVAIAQGNGLPVNETQDFLSGTEATEVVHADNLRAHRLGINGAPCFILGRRHAIAGAQEPEVLECLVNVAVLELAGGD